MPRRIIEGRLAKSLRRGLFAALILTASVLSHAAQHEPVRVLLLHPSDIMLPGAALQDRITREAISSSSKRALDFYSESFDAYRLPGLQKEQEFVRFLNKKYESRAPHLIVAHGPMHNLLQRHEASLWPRSPRMFVDVAAHRVREGVIPAGAPYTSSHLDLAGTLRLALQLQPQTTRVVVIAGASTYDRDALARARRELKAFESHLVVEFMEVSSEPEITNWLSRQRPGTIVLQLTVHTDAAGNAYVARELVGRLARASAAPMYSFYDTYMGYGVVGGELINRDGQRHAIGEIARRLIDGEAPEKISMPAPAPAVCTVDWRQLKRWSIDESRVPAHCAIAFRPLSLWERYGSVAIVSVLVLLMISALAAAAYVQRMRRVSAERVASLRTTELTHAARLGAMGSLVASITHELSQPLTSIHTNAAAGERLIASGQVDVEEIRSILADIRADDARAKAVISHLRELLRKREVSMEAVELNMIVSKALKVVEGAAKRQQVDIVRDFNREPITVMADQVHLQQVVLNLAINGIEAMSAHSAGPRTLTVRTARTASGAAEVSISDTGCGIPPDRMHRLFEPFYSTKSDGMGIGLSIARTIIGAHGGRIWAESKRVGAAFHFTIPEASNELPRNLAGESPRAADPR